VLSCCGVATGKRRPGATPAGGSQDKLTSVTTQGVGAPNRTSYRWTFGYEDGADYGYSGDNTGDLVTRKIEPDGKTVYYLYQGVTLADRGTMGDAWDGRLVTSFYWEDQGVPAPEKREIQRVDLGGSSYRLVYPGGDSYTFLYSGTGPLASVTHDSTGVTTHYRYDSYNNLTKTWGSNATGSEYYESESQPLVSLAYTYGGATGRQITRATATDFLGHIASATFNSRNLPTEFRVQPETGSLLPDQVTQLIYDGGGTLTQGNLTRIVAALGSPVADPTDLEYGDAARPGLPTAVTDSVGATRTASYHPDGTPYQVFSPENLQAPLGDPDRSPSGTTLTLDAFELPLRSTDPQGHQTEITYNALTPNSTLLIVTVKHLVDGSTRRSTWMPRGGW
jgi:hypothetical protein